SSDLPTIYCCFSSVDNDLLLKEFLNEIFSRDSDSDAIMIWLSGDLVFNKFKNTCSLPTMLLLSASPINGSSSCSLAIAASISITVSGLLSINSPKLSASCSRKISLSIFSVSLYIAKVASASLLSLFLSPMRKAAAATFSSFVLRPSLMTSGVKTFIPSNVQRAWSLVMLLFRDFRISMSDGIVALLFLSINNLCALSLHHPLGCDRYSTNSLSLALSRLGCSFL